VWAWCLGDFSPGPLSRLSAPLPELFPTSPSGFLGGRVRSGTAEAVPRKGVFAGRRDNRCARRAHSGHMPHAGGVCSLCWDCMTRTDGAERRNGERGVASGNDLDRRRASDCSASWRYG
jgi:hypothetical protein